jgi:hypothetical protein
MLVLSLPIYPLGGGMYKLNEANQYSRFCICIFIYIIINIIIIVIIIMIIITIIITIKIILYI